MLVTTQKKCATGVFAVMLLAPILSAQVNFASLHAVERPAAVMNSDVLPNAPAPYYLGEKGEADDTTRKATAPKYADTIEPNYEAVRLTSTGKVGLSGRELFSLAFPVNVLLAAGLSHVSNKDPKYGTNSEAFAKRVGAAGARNSSQIILSHAILAPLLKEDVRYYVQGPGHNVLKRAAYAATRVLFSRTDGGRSTINFAELAGYGGSAALTQLYYPERGRNLDIMLNTYGSSLLGLAIQNEVLEFFRILTPHQPR